MKNSLNNFLSFVIVSLTLLFILPTYSVAAQGDATLNKKALKTLLATAKTPAEHRAIAAYYRQQAQALTTKSDEHSAMAEQFTKGPAMIESKQGISFGLGVSHCRHFAKQYAEQAKEAGNLASAHEEMATKAEQR